MACPVAWSRLPVGSSASTIGRWPDQGAGDRDPLPLPARQLGRPGVQPVGEPDRGQRLGRACRRRCLIGTPA